MNRTLNQMPVDLTTTCSRRRLWTRVWILLWPALFILHLFPVRSSVIREVLIVIAATIWIGGTALLWRRFWAKALGIGFGLGLVMIVLLPGSPADPVALRAEYLRSLRGYEGTRYVWGGEAATGIDCSGLLRVSMVDALLRLGVRSGNAELIRQGAAIWWRDCSAQELGRGYSGRLLHVTEARSISSLDHTLLLPGDIAVTRSGEHCMAYLGDNRWIEADPGPMRVITATAPGDLPWFGVGMRILRWESMAETEH